MIKFIARMLDTAVDEYFSCSVYADCQFDALRQLEKDWPNCPIMDLFEEEQQ